MLWPGFSFPGVAQGYQPVLHPLQIASGASRFTAG